MGIEIGFAGIDEQNDIANECSMEGDLVFKLNESEREYRHGDHGPKYLEKGPNMNFGIVKLKPGEKVSPHVHNFMQENFYVLNGEVNIFVSGTMYSLGQGDYIHLEPGEPHKLENRGQVSARLIVTAAPYAEGDKEDVKDFC